MCKWVIVRLLPTNSEATRQEAKLQPLQQSAQNDQAISRTDNFPIFLLPHPLPNSFQLRTNQRKPPMLPKPITKDAWLGNSSQYGGTGKHASPPHTTIAKNTTRVQNISPRIVRKLSCMEDQQTRI